MKYFLGLDVGSSKTHALIADEAGQCIGFGKAGGGNHQNAGYDGLTDVMQKSFECARAMAGVEKAQVAGAGFGIAGYDFPSDKSKVDPPRRPARCGSTDAGNADGQH